MKIDRALDHSGLPRVATVGRGTLRQPSDQAVGTAAPADVLVSIVVPTYKEAANVAVLVPRIASALRHATGPLEIIVVDDDSGDGIDHVVEQLKGAGHNIRLVVRTDQRGLSSAVLRGFGEARGQLLVCLDADLSHPPETIPQMLDMLVRGDADFVIGSRYVHGGTTDAEWGAFRWLNSRVATLLARPFTRAEDPMSGFFALTREAFRNGKDLNPVGYKIGLELMVKCGCRNIREIPIHFSDRQLGESKLTVREQFNYLRHVKRLLDYRYGHLSRFIQFCVVGATGVAVDLVCYALLLNAGVPLSWARAVAILTAMTSNFWFNRRLTFSYGRSGPVLHQYAQFVLTCALGAVLNWSTSVWLTSTQDFFAEYKYLAALIGILAGTVSNFVIASAWVFRKGRPPWQGAPGPHLQP